MKFLKWVLWIFGMLLSLLMGLVACFLLKPEWFINEKTLRLAASIASSKGIEINWEAASVEIKSISLLKKDFKLSLEKPCVVIIDPKFSGCGASLQFIYAINLAKLSPEIGNLENIDVSSFSWNYSEEIRGELDLKTRPNDEWRYYLANTLHLPNAAKIEAKSWVNVKDNQKSGYSVPYKAQIKLSQRASSALAHLEGRAAQDKINLKLIVTASHLIREAPRLKLNDCEFELSRKKTALTGGELELKCSAETQVYLPKPKINEISLPNQFKGKVVGKLNLSSFIPSADSKFDGMIQFQAEPIAYPLLKAEVHLKTLLAGTVSEPSLDWLQSSNIQFLATIPKFEKLVFRLKSTRWAIPAPFSVLHGDIELKGEGGGKGREIALPFELKTRLKSKAQVLNIDTIGKVELPESQGSYQPTLQAEVVLSKIALQLPKMEYGLPPRILADPRFRKANKKTGTGSEQSSLRYRVTVRTPQSQPIILLSNIALAPVPIHILINVNETEPLKGYIQIAEFPVNLFRRKAIFEGLKIDFKSPMSESKLSGSVRVDYVDYQIHVAIASTFEHPSIKLYSDPPLPENQLVSALVFGQPIEDLDADQAASVGSSRAALADRTIGLLSLYVLASTPIQSVSYDPASGAFFAKVRIAKGTSLNLETGAAHTTAVAIRKRLGHAWTIITELKNSPSTGDVASAQLQWSKRY